MTWKASWRTAVSAVLLCIATGLAANGTMPWAHAAGGTRQWSSATWWVTSDGSVYGPTSHGPITGLAKPVVGMATLAAHRQGYWLVAADGGVFTYRDATFHGSAAGAPLKAPVVGIASTPDGGGYWLVAADGGVFTYGDATFHGSAAGAPLNAPVVGIASAGDGGGYWLDASDGGVFSFGDTAFYGSHPGAPGTIVAAVMPTPDDNGYWLARTDQQGTEAFGNAVPYFAATGPNGPYAYPPAVGAAADFAYENPVVSGAP